MAESCLKIILGRHHRHLHYRAEEPDYPNAICDGDRLYGNGRGAARWRRTPSSKRRVLVLVAGLSIRTTTRPEFDGKLGLHLVYLARTSSKNASARVSFDWPSQNMASLRTNGFLLFRAT